MLTDIDLGAIVALPRRARARWPRSGSRAVENPLEFGIVITHEDGTIERFLEKPTWGQVFSDTINTGIYVLEPEIFDYIPRPTGRSTSRARSSPRCSTDGKPLYGAVAEGYWEDVGTLEAYVRAHKDVLDGKVEVDIPGFEISDGVWVGEGAEIHPEAAHRRARSSSATTAGSRPAPASASTRCSAPTCGSGPTPTSSAPSSTTTSTSARTCACAAPSSAAPATSAPACAPRRASCSATSASSASDAVLGAGVKVYPFKTIEAGAVVNSSIVWESRGARSLFGRDGVAGLANVDITPELAARVAMAYGTTLKKGTTVVTSRDSSRSARMLKRAMMAGLNAARHQRARPRGRLGPGHPLPRARDPTSGGGITIRLDAGRPRSRSSSASSTTTALDITEDAQRKIERLFHREDFRRVFPGEIGDIGFPPRAPRAVHASALEATVDVAAIAGAGFKLVVDYAYGADLVRDAQRAGQARAPTCWR